MSRLVFACVFALVLVVGAEEEFKKKFDQYREECIQQTGVARNLPDDVKQGKFTEDAKLKEFIFCVNKKIGYQDENGNFNKDRLKEILLKSEPEDVVNEILSKCLEKKSTPQETAYQALKCGFGIADKQ